MTQQRAKELLPVIQAWVDGKRIQVELNPGVPLPTKWQDYAIDGDPDFENPNWNWRIKPERPEFWIAYRPYKPYPQILERIFVAEENKDNPYWSENGFKVRKFVEVVE